MNVKEYFKGLKVVEFASVLAGPAVGMFFAELGAEVIKIEHKNGGDLTRHWKQSNEDATSPLSAYFHSVNWNKTSIFMDLLNKTDYELAMNHISNADIVIVNFKAGDSKKFGLENSRLLEKFPNLIIGEIIGYPDSDRVAYDAVLQAETGFMSMNGLPETGPLKMPIAFIDLFAAHQLKEGILIALLERSKSNKGSVVSVSLYESAIASLVNQASNWLNNHQVPGLVGSLHPNIAPYGEVLITMDQQQILLAIGTDQQFNKLCLILGNKSISDLEEFKTNIQRVKNRTKLKEILQQLFNNFNADEFLVECNLNKIPAGKINNLKQVFELESAMKMILEQKEKDNSISKRVSTIAFKIKSK